MLIEAQTTDEDSDEARGARRSEARSHDPVIAWLPLAMVVYAWSDAREAAEDNAWYLEHGADTSPLPALIESAPRVQDAPGEERFVEPALA
jgi:hypothetical protein